MSKKTPLHEQHLALGARMIDFAGWQIPLDYGDPLKEHIQVRQDAGMFDLSYLTIIDVTGQGAHTYLRHLLANDIEKLKTIKATLYSCMLNEQGGVLDDLLALRRTPEDYRLIISAANHDRNLAWLKKQSANFRVEITETHHLAMLTIQGPNARQKTQAVLTPEQAQAAANLRDFASVEIDTWLISRTGFTGEKGYEVILPAKEVVNFWQALLKNEVTPCGLLARDSLRLEAGFSLFGADMDESITPLEANLDWSVIWIPEGRSFIGRKALALRKRQGIKKILVGLVTEKSHVLRSRQKIIIPGLGEGMITSACFSPTLDHDIALVRVPIDTQFGTKVQIEYRNELIPAQIVKPPFVLEGKKVFT